MKKLFENKEKQIAFLIFLITMVVAVFPLMTRYCINGHDLEYHLLRIESLKEGIMIGKPFLKVNTLFFANAGYASSMFYSDLFMYIPALLRVMGVGIGASYHIFLTIMFVLCYGSMYYCAYKMTHSRYIATIAAVLLTLCPYHMDDMLIRAACGEIAAFVFIPFVVYGIYNVLYEDMNRPQMFVIGFAGLILSHPATLLFNVMFVAAVLILHIKKIIQNPKLILKLAVYTLLTLVVTAFQWIPMVEQMLSAKFYVSTSTVDMHDAALQVYEVFSDALCGCGPVLLVLAIPRLFLSREDAPILSYVDTLLAGAFAYALLSTKIMPWEKLQRFLGFVQFPWRLMIMTGVLFAFADAIIIVLFTEKYLSNKTEPLICAVMAVCICFSINHYYDNQTGYYDYSNDYYGYEPYTANVIGGEWLPATVSSRENLIEQSHHMKTDAGAEISFVRDRAEIFSAISDSVSYIDVPFIYYKGYEAVLTDDTGAKSILNVTGEGENGMCRVYTEGRTGTLNVWYKGTKLTHFSTFLSLLAVVCIAVMIFMRKKGFKKNIESVKNISIFSVLAGMIFSATLLTGCDAAAMEETAKQLEQFNEVLEQANSGRFTNPDNVVDYLKEQDEEEVEPEPEEEPVYVKYNLSQKGYDEAWDNFGIKVDSQTGTVEYSIISLGEAEDAEYELRDGLSCDLAEEYLVDINGLYTDIDMESGTQPLSTGELKSAIMYEADALLYLEYFPEGKYVNQVTQLAGKLAELIYQSSDRDTEYLSLKYNCAAVLVKASNALEGWESEEHAVMLAKALWEEAENDNSESSSEMDVCRAWAAAELFRYTGQKTYRTIVEAIAQDNELRGFAYDCPGYYCVFAYLSASDNTDYKLSSKMMNDIFTLINGKIKQNRDDLLGEYIKKLNSEGRISDIDYINSMVSDCKLSLMADHISVNIEYIRYIHDRVEMLCGANPEGVDYIFGEKMNETEPMIFVLCGLNK